MQSQLAILHIGEKRELKNEYIVLISCTFEAQVRRDKNGQYKNMITLKVKTFLVVSKQLLKRQF